MLKATLIGVTAAALMGAAAFAQTAGTSSGPAAGKNVEPSTAIQKQEGRSADEMGIPAGAGAPGVEAKPGVQSGDMPRNNMNSNEKPNLNSNQNPR